mgnify:CR=1 FL=1
MTEQIVNSKKIKAGIIGGAGYTGGEMLRILVNHPNVEIAFVNSTSNAGNLISDVHTDLIGDTDLKFTSDFSIAVFSLLIFCDSSRSDHTSSFARSASI